MSANKDQPPSIVIGLPEALQDNEILRTEVSNNTPKSFLFYQDIDEDTVSLIHPQLAAIQRVQSWYRHWTSMKKMKLRFLQYFDNTSTNGPKHLTQCQVAISHLKKLLDLINEHSSSSVNSNPDDSHSFEYVQSLLFSEIWLKSMGVIFNVLPSALLVNSAISSEASTISNKEKLSITAIVKNISSAFLITLFPQDCLALSSDGSSPRPNSIPAELQSKGKDCENAARLLMKQSIQLVATFETAVKCFGEHTSDATFVKRLHMSIERFRFAAQSFIVSFKEWKALDSIRMVKSLEDTFTQSYATLIAAKVEFHLGNADMTLVQSAEHQVEKIKSILLKILGQAKGMSRVEEICAEVEIANSDYSRLVANSSSTEQNLTPKDTVNGINAGKVVVSAASGGESMDSTKPSVPHQQQHQANSANKSEDDKTIKYLEMLSHLAGIENERLAHELTLDKHYRLPLQTSASAAMVAEHQSTLVGPANSQSVKDARSFAEYLKAQMLAAMADKLCNSLRKSNVNSILELRVGMIVPIRIVHSSPYHKSIPTYSAKVLKIVDARSNAQLESVADAVVEEDTVEKRDISQVVWLEVEFMVERSIEQYVSLDRIKLSTEANDPIPFMEALADVCQNVAALTPNRPDLQSKVLREAYDVELLQHILENDVVDPIQDLWPILLRIQRAVIALQAEYRIEHSEKWLRLYEIAFFGGSLSTNGGSPVQPSELDGAKRLVETASRRTIPLLPTPTSSTSDSNRRTIENVLPLIPLFLERTVECVEEIQRDMANYYISLLVPVLERHGHEFLSKRFKMRLQQKLISLDRTANMIMSQLSQFQSLIVDLVEAEACPSTGFTLDELVITSPSSPPSPSPSSPAQSQSSQSQLYKGVIARAIISILQTPVRLDSSDPVANAVIPETLSWDRNRLANIRDLVDVIALESSIVITTRQLLHRYQVTPRESEEIELQHRLDVLLSTSNMGFSATTTSSEDIASASSSTSSSSVDITNIIIEIVNYVQFAIYRTRESTVSLINYNSHGQGHGSSSDTVKVHASNPNGGTAWMNYDLKELKDRVDKAIRDVVSEGNPVLALFTKRVYKVLLRAMLEKPYLQKLSSYSLQSKGQERNLSRLMEITTKLFNHTIKVHGDIYKALVSTLASAATQQSPEAAATDRR